MMKKEQAAQDLPNDALDTVGIEPFDYFAVWQYQAARTNFKLSENPSNERSILHSAEFFSHVLIQFISGVRPERERCQRIYEILFIELK
jgi:hypothetical protein